ncbi:MULTISPECIES: GntR family transcriptional regulator [Halocynthiibacter]|uniref:GntR family transcriptional regulator n=1 Tax=Halocynthiibacter halioticoli TaxID=2986804 RepID=A0AAE3IZS7_9RHOB|nr:MULTISPECIES: GntR family transcriptional regulator [Halocynthiibacter]MCV6825352.1 GntR family transcriptional regulator [Halocynthiibacter halioticoli]MCW4058353.1 GntR family transcriptional regulator [Halocynthiibacter sp. SDUM655004]MDE0588626.1 GntR family transcriptional regulator [Halocynthiibacter sp. C4]
MDNHRTASVTETIYDALYRQIIELELKPGHKMSEAEIARQYDVSRQPVRDAFYRLSKQGLLLVRPQRATVVTHISVSDIKSVQFIRTALEKETVRAAAAKIDDIQADLLELMITRQVQALSRKNLSEFYQWDENFHARICEIAERPEVWDLITDVKAQADRIRFLSLNFDAGDALTDHNEIVTALRAHDGEAAAAVITNHLTRTESSLPRILAEHASYFKDIT